MFPDFLGKARVAVPLSLLMAAMLTACGGGGGDTDEATAAPQTVTAGGSTIESVAGSPTGSASADATTQASSDQPKAQAMAASPMMPAMMMGMFSVTVTWDAPLTQADGGMVSALSGYRIYYGQTSGQYTGSVFVPGGSVGLGTVPGLTSGLWYFTVAAVDATGNESNLGYELSKTL